MIDFISLGAGFLAGLVVTIIGLWKFISARITAEEAQRIYERVMETVKTYQESIADGVITPEEKLEIAENTIAALQETIKDLKQQ